MCIGAINVRLVSTIPFPIPLLHLVDAGWRSAARDIVNERILWRPSLN